MTAKSKQKRLVYEFDDFRLDAAERQLLRNGKAVPIPSKAFDLLLVLVERNGHLVEKDELYSRVWADQIVEESNLTVQMSAIRKALGEGKGQRSYISTIKGRGYRFTADVANLNEDKELVIETETLSRIVIEKEETTDTQGRRDATVSTAKALPEAEAKSLRQRRAILILSGALVLALLAGGLLFWRYASLPKAQDRPTALPFADAHIKQLTTKGKVSNVAISPDGKFYAYALNERGEYKNSLWLGQTDGSSDIQLRPPDDNLVRALAFSPDGKTLSFSLSKGEESQGGLFKMPVLGGVAEKLLDMGGNWFALSPDGKQIAYFRQSNQQAGSTALVIASLDGAGESEIATRPRDKNFSTRSAAWSPDGKLIAVGAGSGNAKQSSEVFVVRVADGHIEQLTASEWHLVSNLIWRRDGQGLIVNATSKTERPRHLWHIDYPAGSASKLSQDTDSYTSGLSISADGKQLLAVRLHRESNIWIAPSADISEARQVTFSAINGQYGWNGFDWTSDGRIIFTAGIENSLALNSMNADGGNIRQITSSGFFDQKPAVTPDGRFIVFQSNRSGGIEIWRLDLDGGDLRQLTTGGGNTAPHITPDGRSVIYISTREGKNILSRISIEGGAQSQITDRVTLADPRVSPDGRFIACGYRADDKSPVQIAIVSIEDGKPLKFFDVPRIANLNQSFRWMPDGKAICYRDWVNGIWKQDLRGGPPKRLEDLSEEKLYNFGWSADGKLFAFVRGREITDAVLIKDSK
jgi:Tol biopolymer transport system component/DNA-binding winged helix-turn-helix (wHTH) protein